MTYHNEAPDFLIKYLEKQSKKEKKKFKEACKKFGDTPKSMIKKLKKAGLYKENIYGY